MVTAAEIWLAIWVYAPRGIRKDMETQESNDGFEAWRVITEQKGKKGAMKERVMQKKGGVRTVKLGRYPEERRANGK